MLFRPMSKLLKCMVVQMYGQRQLSIKGRDRGIMDKLGSVRVPWEYFQVRRKLCEVLINKFRFERVAALGPDFACLEWLMKCGATRVEMSDGTIIQNQNQMREFILAHGLNVNNKKLKPSINIKPLDPKQLNMLINSDICYKNRWSHIPPVYIKAIDAGDSVIADPGFQYFVECKQLEKLSLGFCDFFGDMGIEHLCSGRAIVSLKDLEIIFNPNISDAAFYSIAKLRVLSHAHFYFNPYVYNEPAAKQRLRIARPRCNITYPKVKYIGTGK